MTNFGAYEVIGEVGAGATGRVYRARHRELGREAAIKELGEWTRTAPHALETLRSEASVLARLDHPNVVALYDYVEEPGRAWLAEEWVEGAPLSRILAVHDRLTPEQALGVVRGAVTGLAYAHDRGVVHRDVSVGNILADMEGTSMLVDFGLAAPAGSGSVLGTPASLSPEAARGEPVGKPGDVYSAAAVLYQLLTGRPVFAGNAAQVVTAHRDRPAPALSDHGPHLANLMSRSLAKDPTQRPPDAGAFLAELEGAAERTYGPAWIQRASIAGLVASASAGGAAATVAASGAGAAGPTVIFDAAGTPALGGAVQAAAQGGRAARSTGLKVAAVGTGGLAVAAVVAVALVVMSGDDGGERDAPGKISVVGDDSDREGPAGPEAEPEPSVEETQPSGRYRGTYRFVRIVPGNGAVDASVRDPEPRTWRFAPGGCTESVCRGTIVSSSGASFNYVWNGSTLKVRDDVQANTTGCSFADGTPAPGTLHNRLRTSLAITGAPKDGTVPKLVAVQRVTVLSYRDDPANNCTWNRPVPKYWVKKAVFRRVG